MKKRILSFMLFIIMAVQLLPITAFAAEDNRPAESGTGSSGIHMNPLYDRSQSQAGVSHKHDQNDSVPKNASYITSRDEAAAYLRSAMENRQTYITFNYYSTETPSSDIFYDIWERAFAETGVPTQGDYLRWVWDYYTFTYRYDPSGNGYQYSVTFEVYYFTNARQEAYLSEMIGVLLDELAFTENTSDIEKITTVYTFICGYVTYDYDTLYDDSYLLKFTAYAALVDGTAVCQGYAVLFYRLMRELGVPVRVIPGTSSGGGHAWNIVAVNGKYYNLDSTWDSNFGFNAEYYQYFMRSSENFPDHSRDYEYRTNSFLTAYPMSSVDFELNPGWYQEDENWYYMRDDGYFATGWMNEGGSWYYLAGDGGRMRTGWVWDGGSWYYMADSGIMQTGWVWDGSDWYYLSNAGTMLTGWILDGNSWYYLYNNGTMATGWIFDGSNWYYMANSGIMQTGWVFDGSDWYYMGSNGIMVTGTQTIDGSVYVFNDNGVWVG